MTPPIHWVMKGSFQLFLLQSLSQENWEQFKPKGWCPLPGLGVSQRPVLTVWVFNAGLWGGHSRSSLSPHQQVDARRWGCLE